MSLRVQLAALSTLAAAAALLGARADAFGKDHFLTIGGGYSPAGNQVSLEKNVVFLQKVLAVKRPDEPAHDIFFADGDSEVRVVQYRDPSFDANCPPARRIMAELFGDRSSMDLVYRRPEIASLRGPADRDVIRRRMRELSRELKSGDRLILYVTGHGSGAERDYGEYDYQRRWNDESQEEPEYNHYDTSFYVWEHEPISASDLSGWLDRLPRDVTVVLVMVQCYAGGFAHTIFREADANLGLSAHSRCGFFAQLHDRASSGCTPDIQEADYQDYSTFFWAALGGRTRAGEAVTTADYDGNGRISFLEAHAYALLESKSIDIPTTTSAALLRQYSHHGPAGKDSTDDETENPLGRLLSAFGKAGATPSGEALLELRGPLAELANKARPDQRAVLEELSRRLELGDQATVEDVQRRIKQMEGKAAAAGAKAATAAQAYAKTRERLQEQVRELWPELAADFSPTAMALTSERADDFVAGVTGLAAYEALCQAREREEQAADEQHEVSCAGARLERLLRSCEDIVLAANLRRVAPQEIVARYEQLLLLECGTLGTAEKSADGPASARPETIDD